MGLFVCGFFTQYFTGVVTRVAASCEVEDVVVVVELLWRRRSESLFQVPGFLENVGHVRSLEVGDTRRVG